ncbi:chorismate mutase [Candidatus Daviesbacteria bacterium]|nr:chorismate mutase [Candidatus Daviesbacteria bacterium]
MSNELEDWRKQIDSIDEKILNLLAKRMNISGKIGKFKKEKNVSLLDKKRLEEILTSNVKTGEKLGLSKDLIKNLLHLIHKYSLEIQKKA